MSITVDNNESTSLSCMINDNCNNNVDNPDPYQGIIKIIFFNYLNNLKILISVWYCKLFSEYWPCNFIYVI